MNIDEIQKIVAMIDNVKDEETKVILRSLLMKQIGSDEYVPEWKNKPLIDPEYPAIQPPFKTWPTSGTARVCAACGISLEGTMSYSCPHANCPTGLGPTIC